MNWKLDTYQLATFLRRRHHLYQEKIDAVKEAIVYWIWEIFPALVKVIHLVEAIAV
jgi:hypothetical protein